MCNNDSRNIRFHINSKAVSGSFVLTFTPFIISQITDELDDFIQSQERKTKNKISIQKVNNVYEINLPGFIAVCNKIFDILKRC